MSDKQAMRYRLNEKGNALFVVMLVMALTMLLAASIVNHFSVTEAHDVEESLAKTRAYWAMSGMVDYALSRAREQCDTPFTVVKFTNILNELTGQVDGFTYADDTSYTIAINQRVVSGGSPFILEVSVQSGSGILTRLPNLVGTLETRFNIAGGPPCTSGNDGQGLITSMYRKAGT
ncbi:MAG: hypothetical protein HQM03_11190 [Magnetococcales bacterium]|nr:hypothetical protein [Magnetococcales bacterium]